jgi:hypothetical protein
MDIDVDCCFGAERADGRACARGAGKGKAGVAAQTIAAIPGRRIAVTRPDYREPGVPRFPAMPAARPAVSHIVAKMRGDQKLDFPATKMKVGERSLA